MDTPQSQCLPKVQSNIHTSAGNPPSALSPRSAPKRGKNKGGSWWEPATSKPRSGERLKWQDWQVWGADGDPLLEKPKWNFGNCLIIAALHVRSFNFDISEFRPRGVVSFLFSVRIGGLGTQAHPQQIQSHLLRLDMQSGGKKIQINCQEGGSPLAYYTRGLTSRPQCTFQIERRGISPFLFPVLFPLLIAWENSQDATWCEGNGDGSCLEVAWYPPICSVIMLLMKGYAD